MKKKWFLFGIGCALVLFLLADLCSKQNWFGECSIKYQIRKIQLKQEVRKAITKHKEKNDLLLKEFEKKLEQSGLRGFERAHRNVPKLSEKFTSFKWCGKLCYKMAKDKLCSTHDTQQAMTEVLGPAIILPCEQANGEIVEAVMQFQHKLMEQDNQFRAELAQIANQNPYFDGNLPAREKFMEDTSVIAGKVQSDAVSCMMTALGTAIEAICIRQSVAILVRVGGHISAKLAAAGGSAAVCAVADGPLPIGDAVGAVIVVGSLAWCAYDVYHLTYVMPREMRKSLNESINQYQRNSRREALAAAKKILAEYQKSSETILNSI